MSQGYETATSTSRAQVLDAWRKQMEAEGWEFVVRAEAGELDGFLQFTMIMRRKVEPEAKKSPK